MTRPKIVMGCKPDPTRRSSPDSAWPLRRADGMTWAESKKEQANAIVGYGRS